MGKIRFDHWDLDGAREYLEKLVEIMGEFDRDEASNLIDNYAKIQERATVLD